MCPDFSLKNGKGEMYLTISTSYEKNDIRKNDAFIK